MNLRWSDGYSHAVEFLANEQSLAGNSARALEQFRQETAKKYHDGGTRRNMVHFKQAELHIEIQGLWCNPGETKSVGGLSYFEPISFVAFPTTVENDAAALARCFEQQAFDLMVKTPKLIECIHDTHRWRGAIENMILDIDHSLREGQ